MQVDDAPEDDEARETYNFPPGAYGLVYRADVPDQGVPSDEESSTNNTDAAPQPHACQEPKTYNYHIKVMKWGLVPFWTKRSPDYGSLMRTINCRDDSLFEDRGMWTSMKRRKRCLVVAQGFYEWLKKGPGGKEKIPHFVKRKDGQLMCFAGLWDCVKYEDTAEKLYTYTIITTDSNKQLNFLHDRMPVILDPGSDHIKAWLDPARTKWSRELQAPLKPFEGELECYPVNQEVGKVGNNSPDFIVPIDSTENKKSIANFFGNAQNIKDKKQQQHEVEKEKAVESKISENNAPLPLPSSQEARGQKREHEEDEETPAKQQKLSASPVKSSPPVKTTTGKKPRSATSNEAVALKSSPAKKAEAGSQRITNFFAK